MRRLLAFSLALAAGELAAAEIGSDQAAEWARCIGRLDAVAFVQAYELFDAEDARHLPGSVPWGLHRDAWGEIPKGYHYGSAWFEVREAAIDGLRRLGGPERTAELALEQVTYFADLWMDLSDQMAASEDLYGPFQDALTCYGMYLQLAADGVIRP